MSPANRSGIGKLPTESTSFVGRRRLLTEVKAAFTNTRLVTLVGPGGVGKMSRLSRRRSIAVVITTPLGDRFLDFIGKPKTV